MWASTHYSRYQVDVVADRFEHWRSGAPAATFAAELPPLTSGVKPADIWLALKRAGIAATHRVEDRFTLQLRLRAPRGHPVSIVKSLVDGVVSAMHEHDGSDLDAIVSRLGVALSVPAGEVRELLLDDSSAILGRRRLLWPRSSGVQWNPADEACVGCSLTIEAADSWRLDGEIAIASCPAI